MPTETIPKPNSLGTEDDCAQLAAHEWLHEIGPEQRKVWGSPMRYIEHRTAMLAARIKVKPKAADPAAAVAAADPVAPPASVTVQPPTSEPAPEPIVVADTVQPAAAEEREPEKTVVVEPVQAPEPEPQAAAGEVQPPPAEPAPAEDGK
jgi:hypothetical protein